MSEEKSHASCEHFQLDGMFGVWCSINDANWKYIDAAVCLNYKKSD